MMKNFMVPLILTTMVVSSLVNRERKFIKGLNPGNPTATKILYWEQSKRAIPVTSEMQNYLQNYINATIDPCNNFYKYVCGEYSRMGIPRDKESINQFETLADDVTRNLRYLVEKPFKNKKWKSVQSFKNIQNLYKSCTNRGRLLNLGTSQVSEQIKELGGWPLVEKKKWNETEFSWITFTYKLRNLGLKWTHFLNVYVDIDRSNSSSRIVWIEEGPNYFSSVTLLAGFSSRTIQQYLEYQTDISMYFGASRLQAKKEFEEAMQFAIKIASIQMTPEEKHDITKQNNKYSIKKLTQDYPFVPWLEYINTLFEGWATLTKDDEVNVASTDYLAKLAEILKNTPKRVLANYLMWFVLKESVPYLADHIKAKVNALNEDIRGLHVDVPLWKECLDIISIALPLQINAIYAWHLKESGGTTKSQAAELMNHIKNATKRYILSNYWMGEQTRLKAIEKLDAMHFYIAYPDEVFNKDLLDGVYKNLTMNPAEFYKNMLLATRADTEREIMLLREPINKTEWISHTWSVEINAGYTPDENSIMISAGILQGVFFDTFQPRALNYGSLGFIIGHEITHGFDNMGRHFDKDGTLVSWWDDTTEKNFDIRANCVEALNNRTVIRDNDGNEYQLNGLLTQGETISDIGGIKLAYYAYLDSNKQLGTENQISTLSGYTPTQLFWLAAGATWCSKSRPSAMEEWKSTRAHPPDEHRVNSAVSNNIEFAKDFKCPIGSPMNPHNKCTIWYVCYFYYGKYFLFISDQFLEMMLKISIL